jgi:hypothetical protein
MKRLTMLMVILSVFMFSCKKQAEPERIDYAKKICYIWTGQTEEEKWDLERQTPVCIIWYKYVQPPHPVWRPYKTFSQNDVNDIRAMLSQLLRPEKEESNPGLRTKDKLSLIFYSGGLETLRVREVYFEIKDQIFIGPTGRSNKLGRILLEKQEIDPYFSDVNLVKLGGPMPYREALYRMKVTGGTNHMEELDKIKKETERKLLLLYRENAGANEIRQLKEEWWRNIESEFTKYPSAYPDINEIRKFKEDWWQHIEENVNRLRDSNKISRKI